MWSLLESVFWWLLLILFATITLVLFGFYLRGAFRDRVTYRVQNPPDPDSERYAFTLASLSNSFLTRGDITDFWDEPNAIQQARLDAISKAQRTIDFETFFMTPGKRADDFAAAIAKKVTEGVRVRLIVDSYGTKDISDRYWKRLQQCGVMVSFFNSFNFKAPLDYAGRTHRKLLIIDSQFALVGGAGISDLWDGVEKEDDTQPWLDVEMRIEGEIVAILEGVFSQHWTFDDGVADLSLEQPEAVEESNSHLMLAVPGANPEVRFSPIRAFKYNSIISARHRIWLASPYFLPDENSIDLLVAAKQKGLDVKILTTSKRSDKKPVYYASYEHYGRLLKGGVEIYEYQPSMTHAKMLLVDDTWATTGSANFDPRSFCHNEELDICSAQPKLVEGLKAAFEKGFAQSDRITYEQWQQRSLIKHRILGNLVDFFQWQL